MSARQRKKARVNKRLKAELAALCMEPDLFKVEGHTVHCELRDYSNKTCVVWQDEFGRRFCISFDYRRLRYKRYSRKQFAARLVSHFKAYMEKHWGLTSA